jgi:hypothetical protein
MYAEYCGTEQNREARRSEVRGEVQPPAVQLFYVVDGQAMAERNRLAPLLDRRPETRTIQC